LTGHPYRGEQERLIRSSSHWLFTRAERPCNSYDFSQCCDRICYKPLWVKGLQGLASQAFNCFAILCFAQWDALTILSWLSCGFRLARWLVRKFAKKRFQKLI
jgi:hypothetical protein